MAKLFCLTKKEKGDVIEQACRNFLMQRKIVIITRNFHSKFGEIDLIGLDKNTLIFFEIRFKQNAAYGTAAESVNYAKQQRIKKTAMTFLIQYPHYQKMTHRFDIIGTSSYNGDITFDWQKNAFEGISWI